MSFLKKNYNIFSYKKPIIKDNTFLLWEPCTHSHAEIVPGFAKYLLDLGYHVSILINPKRYKEGLFCRFDNENISYNKMSKRQIRKFFKKSTLDNVQGTLITTIGKLYDGKDLDQAYNFFNKKLIEINFSLSSMKLIATLITILKHVKILSHLEQWTTKMRLL